MKQHLLKKISKAVLIICGLAGVAQAQTAIDLGGYGNKVTAPYSFDLTNGFTLEYDIYMHSLINFNGCVTSTTGNQPQPLDTYIDNTGTMGILMGNNNVAASSTIPGFAAGQWYNIAIVFNPSASAAYVYVNGTLLKTLSVASSSLGNNGIIIIGNRDDGATDADAKFDNVRIWSGARSAAQVAADENACLTGSETGLQVMYNMNEGAGVILHDMALADGSSDGLGSGSVAWTTGYGVGQITTQATSSYTSPSGKHLYIASGTYMDTVTSAEGCDSIIIVNLTITHHVYVDSANISGTHDGNTWATAFNDFQAGVNAANGGDSVFVAKGSYQPGSGNSFSLPKDSIQIYGGFAGTESNLAQRNLAAGDTSFLVGNGSSVMYLDGFSTNITQATVIDGFALINGNGGSGGGMDLSSVSPSLSNLMFRNNYAGEGGAMEVDNSSVTLTNSVFKSNTSGDGAGAIDNSFGILTITQGVFINNYGSNAGGAIRNIETATLTNVIFSNNSTNGGGSVSGAVENQGTLTITNGAFSNNTSNYGGAIRNLGSETLTNVTFSNNSATNSGSGGAIYDEGGSIITNAVFWGNSATSGPDISYILGGPSITYSYTQSAFSGTGNITGTYDPFVNDINPAGADGKWGTADDGLHLLDTASEVNAGNNSAVSGVTTDVTGVSQRIQNTTVDMGAYENGCITIATNGFTVNTCGNYTSPSGKVWTTSGVYSDTIKNIAGCDSIIQNINLIVNNSSTGDTTATACGSFTWYGNGFTSSGTPTQILKNKGGCDSTVTLHLTINPTTTGDTTANACANFKWYGTNFTQSVVRTHILSNAAGCDSLVTLNLTVNPTPTATISGKDTINQGATDTLTATGGSTYSWSDGSTSNPDIVSPSATQTYTVTVTSASGCSTTDTITVVVNITTGVNSVSTSNSTSAFPNPVANMLNLNFKTTATTDAKIEVCDETGKVILTKEQTLSNGEVMQIDVSSLASGLYFVKIVTSKQTQVIRFIKL